MQNVLDVNLSSKSAVVHFNQEVACVRHQNTRQNEIAAKCISPQ